MRITNLRMAAAVRGRPGRRRLRAGTFQAEHDPGAAEGYLGDQVLESFAVGGRA
jgi:hypothetical protein